MTSWAVEHAPTPALVSDDVDGGECAYADQLRDFVQG